MDNQIPKEFGISKDRVTNSEINEEAIDVFTCPICFMLCKEPLVDRSQCEAAFCKSCLNGYWNEVGTIKCPMRCTNPNFVSPSRIERLHLKSITILCRFKANGCSESLQYDGLESHEKNCKYQDIQCIGYTECKTVLPMCTMQEHESICEYIWMKCDKCFKYIQRKERGTHDCVEHLLGEVRGLNKRLQEEFNQKRFLRRNLVSESNSGLITKQQLKNTQDQFFEARYKWQSDRIRYEERINQLEKIIKSSKDRLFVNCKVPRAFLHSRFPTQIRNAETQNSLKIVLRRNKSNFLEVAEVTIPASAILKRYTNVLRFSPSIPRLI